MVNENVIPMQLDESIVNSQENNESDSENVSFSDFDHNKLVANLFIQEKSMGQLQRLHVSLV